MPNLFKIIKKSPFPQRWKLEWQRSLLLRLFAKDIKKARKDKNKDKVDELQREMQFEMQMHEEDEDNYFTKVLLRKARKLRVPIPHKTNEADEESEFWYQGNYTGGWYLTNIGISNLRQEIRKEINAQHESKSKWIVWVSALTGIIGAITGLVAVLGKTS